ncbi:hypothetical protein MIR68_011525 [Amoeboaphelidium protococcarum]|nr:hypothetical protein MIR68_011525 [Amoeboaphelidium protococcarum]
MFSNLLNVQVLDCCCDVLVLDSVWTFWTLLDFVVSVFFIEVTTRFWYEKQVADVIHFHSSDEFVIATCFAQCHIALVVLTLSPGQPVTFHLTMLLMSGSQSLAIAAFLSVALVFQSLSLACFYNCSPNSSCSTSLLVCLSFCLATLLGVILLSFSASFWLMASFGLVRLYLLNGAQTLIQFCSPALSTLPVSDLSGFCLRLAGVSSCTRSSMSQYPITHYVPLLPPLLVSFLFRSL